MRWLIRFGYDGSGFYGWARQPGLRTVEGEIRAGLVRQGVATSPAAARLEVASRTDRGVHARANVLAVSSDRSGPSLLRGFNGIAPDIFCTAAVPVPEGLRVRHAVRRVYRYFEPRDPVALESWQEAARLFRGPVDVRSFGRGLRADSPTVRTMESVEVRAVPGGLVIEFRAPSFVWGMVRKMVGAMREYDGGRLSLTHLRAALEGKERLTLPLAEPERLVLWEVEYPISWTIAWSGPNRHQSKRETDDRDSLWVRREVLRALRSSD
jgi:tRNA pseudouridine38-40 synthase